MSEKLEPCPGCQGPRDTYKTYKAGRKVWHAVCLKVIGRDCWLVGNPKTAKELRNFWQ